MNVDVTLTRSYSNAELVLCPGENLLTGSKEFIRAFGPLSSMEQDLLILASSVMACDLAQKRGERENIARDYALHVPVVNHQLFTSLKVKIENLLYLLSNDNWTINFKPSSGDDLPPYYVPT